jgi:hypothetical protein
MRCCKLVHSTALALACSLIIILPSSGRGQTKKAIANSDEVTFDTYDGVELRGTFYPAKKAKASCVIFLHKFGENRQKQGWDALAQALLDADFAVLAFDFRGHGDSTNVNSDFWKHSQNFSIRNGGPGKTKISHKEFAPGYVPFLANDVAAAKRFLEKQNDAGVCNASNIVVVGAEEGAAIGALWIATEWERKPLVQNPFSKRWLPDPQGKVAGEDIASAVWLSIPSHLNGFNVAYWLTGRSSQIRDKVPMAFFYGDRDSKAAAAATSLLDALKKRGKQAMEFTRGKAKRTSLAGQELLGKKNLNTEEEIATYLGRIMQNRGMKAWVQRIPGGGQDVPLFPIPLQQFGVALR